MKKSFGQFLTQLLGNPVTSPQPARLTRSALTLPDWVCCARCGQPTLISETTRVYMPDEDSDYHRVCKDCAKGEGVTNEG
jgi:ribosomal protein L32